MPMRNRLVDLVAVRILTQMGGDVAAAIEARRRRRRS